MVFYETVVPRSVLSTYCAGIQTTKPLSCSLEDALDFSTLFATSRLYFLRTHHDCIHESVLQCSSIRFPCCYCCHVWRCWPTRRLGQVWIQAANLARRCLARCPLLALMLSLDSLPSSNGSPQHVILSPYVAVTCVQFAMQVYYLHTFPSLTRVVDSVHCCMQHTSRRLRPCVIV